MGNELKHARDGEGGEVSDLSHPFDFLALFSS